MCINNLIILAQPWGTVFFTQNKIIQMEHTLDTTLQYKNIESNISYLFNTSHIHNNSINEEKLYFENNKYTISYKWMQ